MIIGNWCPGRATPLPMTTPNRGHIGGSMTRKYTQEQVDRFYSRLDRSGECWLWTGAIWGNNGYGCTRFMRRSESAHRVAWRIEYGPIPDGLCVLHRCDTPLCVRPTHLFLGTQMDNSRDAAAKGRTSNGNVGKTHCKREHEFTLENTRLDGKGRQCRACDVIRRARKYGRQQTREDAKVKDRQERMQCRR